MKLLYVEMAKVIWLFDTRLLNPKGLNIQPLIKALKERFQFAAVPAHSHDRKDNALVFEGGSFVNPAGESIGAGLKIYSDGIVSQTTSDTTNTLVFNEQLRRAVLEEGFEFPEGIGEVGFASQLRVVCDKSLLGINPRLAAVARFLESRLSSLDGKPRTFEVAGIQLFSQDVSKPLAPIPFKFERKHGVAFAKNEYFTQAPLQTAHHLELLEQLEKLLAE